MQVYNTNEKGASKVKILDHNGAEKFESQEVQFDENFTFNEAEKEVRFNSNNFLKSIKQPFEMNSVSVHDLNINSSTTINTASSIKFFDSVHFNENTSKKWLDVNTMFTKSLVDGAFDGTVLANGISPNKVKIELFLEIKSAHSYWYQQKLMPIYYEELTQANLINGIRFSNTLGFFNYKILCEKLTWGASNTGWITDKFTLIYPKIINGVRTEQTLENSFRNEPNHKNGIYASLDNIDFGYKGIVTVEFSDATNSNSLNKKYTANISLKESSIKILS